MLSRPWDRIVWCRVVMTLVDFFFFFFLMWKGFLFLGLGMVSILERSYSGHFNSPHQISTSVLTATGGQVLQLRHYQLLVRFCWGHKVGFVNSQLIWRNGSHEWIPSQYWQVFVGSTSHWVPISVDLFGPGRLSSLAMIAVERKSGS